MKRTARVFSLLLALVLCLSVLPVGTLAASNGWVKDSYGDWYYYENGSPITGWRQISGIWYYFRPSAGYMVADGWVEYPEGSNTWYHFSSSGAMDTNKWVHDGDNWSYQLSSGKGAMGWLKVGGVWYYFDPDNYGYMATGGPYEIDGLSYYFKDSGAMYTGWKQIDGDWWYFTSSGDAAEGWKQISGKWYYFAYHKMLSDCWASDDHDNWFYLGADGAMLTSQWVREGGNWYYVHATGDRATQWWKVGGVWYYFNPNDNGRMLTGGPHNIVGKYYFFKDSGALYTGWKQISGHWMYFTVNGAYANTTRTIDGKSYSFDSHGFLT